MQKLVPAPRGNWNRFSRRVSLMTAGVTTGCLIGALVLGFMLHLEFAAIGGIGGGLWGALVAVDAPRSTMQVVVKTTLTAWLAGPLIGLVLFAFILFIAGVGP
jgi:hypothetical protein